MTAQPLPGYEQNPDLKGFAGKVRLKDYKRARPIVLRANVGDILEIRFTNLLNQTDPSDGPIRRLPCDGSESGRRASTTTAPGWARTTWSLAALRIL